MVQYKETILFTGGDSVGKTTCLFELAKYHPNSKCILIDFENKTQKIQAAFFADVTNVEIFNVLNWHDVEEAFTEAKKRLGPGDWLLIDGLDKAWDIAQVTYDATNKEHGPDAWRYIKKIHNKEFLDVACGRAPFNVGATAWAAPNQDYNIDRETDAEIKQELQMWKQIGFRPGGEKRNTSRFDTVFALKAKLMPRKNAVTTYKDKGRPYLDGGKKLWLEFDFPFWPIYVDKVDTALTNGETVVPLE